MVFAPDSRDAVDDTVMHQLVCSIAYIHSDADVSHIQLWLSPPPTIVHTLVKLEPPQLEQD